MPDPGPAAAEREATALASDLADLAAGLSWEMVAAFRHGALNNLDRLSLHLSNVANALEQGDPLTCRESIAEMDVELQLLARAIDSLKVLRADPRDAAEPLTDVWDRLVKTLEGRARQAGVELKLCRDARVDPLMPEPVSLALMSVLLMGLKAAGSAGRRHRLLIVKANRSRGDQVTLRVRFPAALERNNETTLTIRLVTALLAGSDGHSCVPASEDLSDLTMCFPLHQTSR